MLYLLAIVLPPVAVLACGKPIQALFNIILTLLGWIPGMIHALFIVSAYHADQRTQQIVTAIQRSSALEAEREGGPPVILDSGRIVCAYCGYGNRPERRWCKKCKRDRLVSEPSEL